MQLFFAREKEGSFFLDEKETYHCTRVLRKKNQEFVYFTTGKGDLNQGRLLLQKNIAFLENVTLVEKKPLLHPYIHLAIAPTKQFQRMEWFLEKAVECGINEISFILTQRTERTSVSLERVEHIIHSAMKQSMMLHEPLVNGPMPWKDFIHKKSKIENAFYGICKASSKSLYIGTLPKQNAYVISIGPEGDFTDEEWECAVNKNYVSVILGGNRLRTETAGLFSLIALRTCFGY
ncbi:MAG: 16S rRNA (uracil(1498)-N(3))-methyltransferase [Bacteroidia bacterium]|nr:16S rRNA (uracil(1498)-N(3))-methyltransferase [Bacteroidia bacterium]